MELELMTLRDKVWDEALREIHDNGRFKISDLPFDESERHTVRRVLKRMEKSGWLSRETPNSAIWRLGPDAEDFLSVSDEVKDKAKA